MRLYALTQSSASDYPSTAPPFITEDRELVAKAWMDCVVEALGYPDDDADPDDVSMVKSLINDWIEHPDDPNIILEWVVNNDGPVDEMMTYEVHTVEVPETKQFRRRNNHGG
jgi:hypothetical protein